MSKYKLVKEYPNSPSKNYTAAVNSSGFITFNGIVFDPSAYPDYWEEIIEKDYEILSLIGDGVKEPLRILNSQTNLYKHKSLTNGIELTLEFLLKSGYSIYSIKRLSDGEIFTIGDKLNMDMIIEQFTFEDFGSGQQLAACDKDGGRFLSELKKAKTPLFKTEDGVDIFEGDYWWYLYTEPIGNWKESVWISTKGGGENHNYCPQYGEKIKRFSSEEKAEEYIIMNKSCLSLEDIASVFNIKALLGYGELKELVKIKLNK